MYEEAIDLCTMSAKSGSPLEGVDVSNLYNVSAASCLAKGDYEKAVAQYLLGDSNVLDVIASFPQFVADSIGEILKSYGKVLFQIMNLISFHLEMNY